MTDTAGAEIRRLAYRAFGEEAENLGSGEAPKYSYTGKERDSSGLMYYGTRYYDPALSRFITPDTIYDRGPQGLNRYSYALNNPIRYNDPSGNASKNTVEFDPINGLHTIVEQVPDMSRVPPPGEAYLLEDKMPLGNRAAIDWLGNMAATATGADANPLTGERLTSDDRVGSSIDIGLLFVLPAILKGAGLPSSEIASIMEAVDSSDPIGGAVGAGLSKALKKVIPGNPQVTAGGQTALGGMDPCITNSEQIASRRGYGTEIKGDIRDLLNRSESIVPGVYEAALPPAHPNLPERYHQVVVNENGTLTDVSLNLNMGKEISSNPPQPDTWELHDYYYNVLGHEK